MADNLSSTAENKALDHLTGTATYTVVGPLYLALLTGAPSDDFSPDEVDGGGYSRQALSFDAATAGATANSTEVTFTGMPECTVAGFALYDDSPTPQLIWQGPTSSFKQLVEGDTFIVAAGALVLSLG